MSKVTVAEKVADTPKETDTSKESDISKLVRWIKTHRCITTLIAIAAFLIPLLFVQLLYKWRTSVYLLQSDWFSGDLITYIAGFLSFFGSVALSLVAIYQNDELDKTNKHMINNEEKRDKFERQPCVMLAKWSPITQYLSDFLKMNSSLFQLGDLGETDRKRILCIELTLINAAKSFVGISVVDFRAGDGHDHEFPVSYSNCILNPQSSGLIVAPEGNTSLHFITNLDNEHYLNGAVCKLVLELVNSISEYYTEEIDFIILSLKQNRLDIKVTNFSIRENVKG